MQEPIPAQEAALTIPFQNLLDLPEGAGYRHRDGRASVDIRRQGDSLTVTGHCDSLMRRCLFYEEEVSEGRSGRTACCKWLNSISGN